MKTVGMGRDRGRREDTRLASCAENGMGVHILHDG